MRNPSPLNPSRLITLLLAAAMVGLSVQNATVSADAATCRQECGARKAQAAHTHDDDCCRKTAPAEGVPASPPADSPVCPHCPCCVTICGTPALVIADAADLPVNETACFDLLASPRSLRGGDWVDDLFHPPCL